ncbi:MAG: BON domain-containing protein, partial [Ktedonobacterales bacterium]
LLLALPGPQTQRVVKVRVEDGHVDLGGQLETSEQVAQAAQVVKTIHGVRGLTVNLIAQDAVQTQVEAMIAPVAREQQVGPGSVRVQCEHGIVYLEGAVPTKAARAALERTALAAPGVRVVVNNLAVGDEPPPSRANGTGPLVRNR